MKTDVKIHRAISKVFLLILIPLCSIGYSTNSDSDSYSHQQNPANTVTSNTVLKMRMENDLSSRTSRVGDRFTATVTEPVRDSSGRTLIPSGVTVEGHVTDVVPAKRMSRSGMIAVDFDEMVLPGGSRVRIAGSLTSLDPDERREIDDESRVSGKEGNRPVVFVGAGGAVGAVLGGIAGGGKGAVLGGIAGAGAGITAVLLSKGVEAEVNKGTGFGLQLSQDLVISEAYSGEKRRTTGDEPRTRREPSIVDTPSTRPSKAENPATSNPTPPEAVETEVVLPLSSPEMIKRAQVALRDQGYYEGPIDGNKGERITKSLKIYQKENKIAETGELDQETAKSLGILGANRNPVKTVVQRTPRTSDDPPPGGARQSTTAPGGNNTERSVPATITSATAKRDQDGTIRVVIRTRASTGGWKWFEEHKVTQDILEVYAKAVRNPGPVTQALTQGNIELALLEGTEGVRRVNVYGAGGLQQITLNQNLPKDTGAAIQKNSEDLLAECRRFIDNGKRTRSGQPEYNNDDIDLLFALNNLSGSARLYVAFAPSMTSKSDARTLALSLSREARRTDIIITTRNSKFAQTILPRWDTIRQDVLQLMRAYGISVSEIDL